MTRLVVASGILAWVAATLLLSAWGRLDRPNLADRLAPYHPGPRAGEAGGSPAVLTAGQLLLPAVSGLAERLAGLFGVSESAARRLRRIHSPLDPPGYRLRQLSWMGGGVVAGLVTAAAGAPAPLAVLVLLGAPLLSFLVAEQRLAAASAAWQERLAREVPVVAEQLGMLINAGFSLSAAIARVAERGRGAAAADLRVVTNRLRQGVPELSALEEWADIAGVEAVTRLVGVLALNSEAHDLGRLVGAEARQARRDLHRRTVELIERRAQQVWIPVSVATLVPGVILLAIPFLAALRLFANA